VKITNIHVHSAPMTVSWLTDTLIANPMSGYPAYREKRSSWFGEMMAAVVEIETDAGVSGLGYMGGGRGQLAAPMIDGQFRQLLTGRSPFETELIWEQLYRASIMYGRRGAAIEVISAIDIALWDVLGKVTGQPVYNLIGGKTRDRIRAYVTGNLTDRHLQEGFRDVKLALPHGPADGSDGLRENAALVEKVRRKIGDHADLMLDCYMSLDVPYAIKLAQALRDFHIAWLEEPFLPDQVESFLRLKDAAPDLLLSTGEHEFTRWGFHTLLEKRAADIVQPDIYRAGGISELKKIAAMASAYNVPVIPHGIGAPTYHFVISNHGSPRAEFVDVFAQGGELLLEGEPTPKGGWIELDDSPGFGYRLNQRALRGEVPVAPIW
jgi:L-rhamnonate dehydratase